MYSPWLDCIRFGKEPPSNFDIGHLRSSALSVLAMLLFPTEYEFTLILLRLLLVLLLFFYFLFSFCLSLFGASSAHPPLIRTHCGPETVFHFTNNNVLFFSSLHLDRKTQDTGYFDGCILLYFSFFFFFLSFFPFPFSLLFCDRCFFLFFSVQREFTFESFFFFCSFPFDRLTRAIGE